MKILVTGATGQTGSYLCEILLAQGHNVHGLKRRTSTNNTSNLVNCINLPNFTLVEGDVTDQCSITDIIRLGQYDRIYHLAAQSHVHSSFKQPAYTCNTIYNSTLYILEGIKNYSKDTRLFHSATSEMFGKNYITIENGKKIQNENTPFCPQSPYSIAKLSAFHLVRLYREAYGLYACSGIIFNMESPRRGEQFVTKKITKYVARLYHSLNTGTLLPPPLPLGNLNASRDWGYARDYAEAIVKFLDQQDISKDMVISTDETRTINELLKEAFSVIDIIDYQKYITIDPEYYRPAEVDYLLGDSSLARKTLGWEPTVTFKELINLMVIHDIQSY